MMDQKTWLWRKRSSEKTIVANGDEVEPVPVQREVDLENSLKTLNEKLSSVLDECSAKDKLVQDYEKMVEDAVADKNKAEEEVRRLKEELAEVQQQRAAANDRLGHLNSALKDCMEQLNLVRDGQEQRIHDAVMNTSQEFEKAHKRLEEKLLEMSKRLADVTSENAYLSKALLVKEKLIDDLNHIKSQTEAEFQALMTRLDSIEKENAFLRYEFRALEKELDLRNEEVLYGRRAAEASNKQHSENIKKIKKLEAECQRLRALTRKRLPGPAILANIKSDIEEKFELTRPNPAPDELSFPSGYDIVEANEITTSSSLATAIVPEQGHDKFTDPQIEPVHKMIGASEMSLLDDFVEMEKLAIVAVESPLEDQTNSMTKELVPVGHAEFSDMNHELKAKEKPKDWLQDVKNMVLKQHNISKRSLDELLGDIRMALNNIIHPEPSKLLPISGYITWKSPASSPRSSSIQESSNEFQQSDVNASMRKIMELVGRFDLPCSEGCKMQDDLLVGEYNNSSYEQMAKATDYSIRVLRWKGSSLTTVFQEFIHSCNNLLEGKINFEKFTGDLTSALGWIINNCVSYQDDFTVRDAFRKHLGGDGPGTALELESVQNLMLEMEKMYSIFQAEIKQLKNDLNLIKTSVDVNLQAERQNEEPLMQKLEQSLETIASLENELEILKESERTTEDQIENLKVINEDLDTQLTVTRAKLNEVLQKLSSLEVELENKRHCCEELEGTCLELQLQLESITSNQHSQENENQEGLLRTGMEITRASVKLAECEKTILKLGNQLKALGSARQLSVVDKVLSITDTKNKKSKPRSSLLDQMISEDNSEVNHVQSPKTKVESKLESNASQAATPEASLGKKNETKSAKAGTLVIVPIKKGGGGIGLLRKLLLRRKKGSSSASIYFGK
ncbi:UNVERIFIED_CONTAM: Filament-like plant protein 7 [Sesamum radiatum]|uniref:Filament-like plant protein 7 n=1 Tax=Sesamum radiatum TaxID=300843 RepID=A0AAW2MUQ5_SESRA